MQPRAWCLPQKEEKCSHVFCYTWEEVSRTKMCKHLKWISSSYCYWWHGGTQETSAVYSRTSCLFVFCSNDDDDDDDYDYDYDYVCKKKKKDYDNDNNLGLISKWSRINTCCIWKKGLNTSTQSTTSGSGWISRFKKQIATKILLWTWLALV